MVGVVLGSGKKLMKRREFIALLGGAAIVGPLAARAQSPRKLRTIGFLVSGARSSHGPWFATLAERLGQLGWIEGREIKIEYRWAEGRPELYTESMVRHAEGRYRVSEFRHSTCGGRSPASWNPVACSSRAIL
jgi:hypothetical protein